MAVYDLDCFDFEGDGGDGIDRHWPAHLHVLTVDVCYPEEDEGPFPASFGMLREFNLSAGHLYTAQVASLGQLGANLRTLRWSVADPPRDDQLNRAAVPHLSDMLPNLEELEMWDWASRPGPFERPFEHLKSLALAARFDIHAKAENGLRELRNALALGVFPTLDRLRLHRNSPYLSHPEMVPPNEARISAYLRDVESLTPESRGIRLEVEGFA